MFTPRALGLNCSLKHGDAPSSTDAPVTQVLDELKSAGYEVDGPVRVADLDVLPGVSSDEGPGDDWPDLRRRILDADILVFGTPIWLGQPSSVAKRVLERWMRFSPRPTSPTG
jgi:multimeric flavodoxin WrbA